MNLTVTGNRDWIPQVIRDIALMRGVIIAQQEQQKNAFHCEVLVHNSQSQVTAAAVFSFYSQEKAIESITRERVATLEEDLANQEKRLVKKVFYEVLVAYSGGPSPWGILTGIRPTKLVHRLLDQGHTSEAICQYLEGEYGVSTAKSQLLTQVAERQRPFLLTPMEASKKVGIYVGIPFCPSRCHYCSFPAYPLTGKQELKEKFLEALHREIREMGAWLQRKQLTVEHIYLGGGTPTSIKAIELGQLLLALNEAFRGKDTKEVTVEGGRPDTLSKEIAQLMKEHQVTRVSVNPQTLQDETLRLIGRNHTTADFWQAYNLMREVAIPVINIDLIIGLPGEGLAQVESTLEQLAKAQLDNLTIHPLALKRASKLMESPAITSEQVKEGEKMVGLTEQFAKAQHLLPYYLYRQKRMLNHGENLGYCKPGMASIYNIQMMEERQTIIGLGCGAGSKWVNPTDWTLTASYNPKEPQLYIQDIEQLIHKKIAMLEQLF